jgi:predicted esterase
VWVHADWQSETERHRGVGVTRLSRREFALIGTAAVGSWTAASCTDSSGDVSTARITLTSTTDATTAVPGTHSLGLDSDRDATLFVPQVRDGLIPLIVLLHGAGGSGASVVSYLRASVEECGAAILAPDSRGRTWDAILGDAHTLLDVVTGRRRLASFGVDVAFLNRALSEVFTRVAVDRKRMAIAGFSDGATYALSVGLTYGDIFSRIVAFSPGFVIEGEPRGQPQVFISHGERDDVLPIERCSRRIVPQLEREGYDVTYREFGGGHEVPEVIAREGLKWALGP